MSENTQGATPPVAEPGNGLPQAQQTQAPAQQEPTPQSQGPSIEDLQKQIAERDDKLRLAADSARHWQSQADRYRGQAQALTGVQPQVDPNASKVQMLVSKGYSADDAQTLVGLIGEFTAPLIQQNQQLQQTVSATTQVGQAFQMAAGDKDYGALFQDPDIANQVHQELQRVALNGQANFVSPEYAKEIAAAIWTHKNKPWAQQSQQAMQVAPQYPQNTPPAYQGGFMGPRPGFQPAAAQQRQVDPAVQHYNNEIRDYMGLPKPK